MKAKHLLYLWFIASLLVGTWILPAAADEPTASTGPAVGGAPVDLTLGVIPPPSGPVGGGSVPAGGPPLLVLDDFNRANGPLGPDWTVLTGTCGIVSQAARCNYGNAYWNDPLEGGSTAEVDIKTNGTPLQYAGVTLHVYPNTFNYPFLKFQDQSGDGKFEHGGCYLGNNGAGGQFGLYFYALSQPFASAHLKATQAGTTVTIELTNIEGGTLPDQTYVCTGAPSPAGDHAGILGYANLAQNDNFGIAAVEPEIRLVPEIQSGSILPGDSDTLDLDLVNLSGMDETVDLTYAATGPGTCYGPATSPPIQYGATWTFQVTVEVNPEAQPGDSVDCEIYAAGQNSGYDDTAWIHIQAGVPAFATHVRIFLLPSRPWFLGGVRIVDEALEPVPGATATLQWTRPLGYIRVHGSTTNASGWAFAVTPAEPSGSYSLDLLDVTAPLGFVYVPGMNWESGDSYTLP